jgi:hypothetical protein
MIFIVYLVVLKTGECLRLFAIYTTRYVGIRHSTGHCKIGHAIAMPL